MICKTSIGRIRINWMWCSTMQWWNIIRGWMSRTRHSQKLRRSLRMLMPSARRFNSRPRNWWIWRKVSRRSQRQRQPSSPMATTSTIFLRDTPSSKGSTSGNQPLHMLIRRKKRQIFISRRTSLRSLLRRRQPWPRESLISWPGTFHHNKLKRRVSSARAPIPRKRRTDFPMTDQRRAPRTDRSLRLRRQVLEERRPSRQRRRSLRKGTRSTAGGRGRTQLHGRTARAHHPRRRKRPPRRTGLTCPQRLRPRCRMMTCTITTHRRSNSQHRPYSSHPCQASPTYHRNWLMNLSQSRRTTLDWFLRCTMASRSATALSSGGSLACSTQRISWGTHRTIARWTTTWESARMTRRAPSDRWTRTEECRVSEESVITLFTRASSKIMFIMDGADILAAKVSTGASSTWASDTATVSGWALAATPAKATGWMDRWNEDDVGR